jgi:hypothetical protein
MIEVTELHAVPEIERKEREAEPLVLPDVPELVTPRRLVGLGRRHDHMTEGNRAKTASSENEMRDAPVADIEEAAVPATRQGTRQEAEGVTDGVRVMRGEQPAQRY